MLKYLNNPCKIFNSFSSEMKLLDLRKKTVLMRYILTDFCLFHLYPILRDELMFTSDKIFCGHSGANSFKCTQIRCKIRNICM